MTAKIAGFEVAKSFEYENAFYATSAPSRLAKIIAHYELYKMITELPGAIVECGIYKGVSLTRFSTFRHAFENDDARKIIGFDAFGKFPKHGDATDERFIQHFEDVGGDGLSVEVIEEIMANKGFKNIELISGDICKTVPKYCERHPELKIALLHIDVDVYAPTVAILENMFSKVVRGGLIVLDDYGTIAGETRAVDEFLAKQDRTVKISKLPLAKVPAYIRME
jgi:hypothetical protein